MTATSPPRTVEVTGPYGLVRRIPIPASPAAPRPTPRHRAPRPLTGALLTVNGTMFLAAFVIAALAGLTSPLGLACLTLTGAPFALLLVQAAIGDDPEEVA